MDAFDQMRVAVFEANKTIVAADTMTTDIASMIRGRLHKITSTVVLSQLKAELRDYNMVTGKWKGK